MTKIKALAFAVLALFILNLATIGFLILNKPQFRGNRDNGPKNIIIKKLHFTQAQIENYQLLIDEHQSQMKSLRDELMDTKRALYKTLNNKNSSALSDSLIHKTALINTKIEQLNYHHFEQIKQLCKPNQIKYFEELTGELAQLFNPKNTNRKPPPQH
jgi:uncharacterized membrane-anchored protein YhcB (DUF1043 family)